MAPYGPIKEAMHSVETGEFNLRERLNIYAGIIGGFFSPILATKYIFFDFISKANWGSEEAKWAWSLPAAIVIPATLEIGAAFGNFSARKLKKKRQERESHESALVPKILPTKIT